MPPHPTTFPPTPAPSTDIKGREQSFSAPNDHAFVLPPAAVHAKDNDAAAHTNADTSAAFASPLSPAQSSRHSSDVSLPPPPARSRKIIQVKPKGSSEERDSTYSPQIKAPKPAGKEPGSKRKSTANAAAGAPAGTAAGRKVARKTAHSIIERRRRSKMNEEFGVLKDLIPACRGCEMHKLAILQASIEYLRYLEKCVSELKAGRATSSEAPSLPSHIGDDDDEQLANDDDAEEAEEPSDVEMELDDAKTKAPYSGPAYSQPTSGSVSATASPVEPSFQPLHRSSTSSTATSTLPSPYFGPVSSRASQPTYSNTTSPMFGPYNPSNPMQSLHHARTSSRASISHPFSISQGIHSPQQQPLSAHPQPFQTFSRLGSAQTSPVIYPQHQGLNEAEASTALLMLNQDRGPRRATASSSHASERRGLSVKDLLSS